jgi:hypothetical protein
VAGEEGPLPEEEAEEEGEELYLRSKTGRVLKEEGWGGQVSRKAGSERWPGAAGRCLGRGGGGCGVKVPGGVGDVERVGWGRPQVVRSVVAACGRLITYILLPNYLYIVA